MNELILSKLEVQNLYAHGKDVELGSLAQATTATASTLTYPLGVTLSNYTGAAAQLVTLPAAEVGAHVVHLQQVDTTGGTATLIFDCAGTDVIADGQTLYSTGSSKVILATTTGAHTRITFTPANAATNGFTTGSELVFWCEAAGEWKVAQRKLAQAAAAVTGTFVSAA
tara:strand:+ start:58 stop:564 length:507 start_codon:yes stop_codon:yes gene_type:complete